MGARGSRRTSTEAVVMWPDRSDHSAAAIKEKNAKGEGETKDGGESEDGGYEVLQDPPTIEEDGVLPPPFTGLLPNPHERCAPYYRHRFCFALCSRSGLDLSTAADRSMRKMQRRQMPASFASADLVCDMRLADYVAAADKLGSLCSGRHEMVERLLYDAIVSHSNLMEGMMDACERRPGWESEIRLSPAWFSAAMAPSSQPCCSNDPGLICRLLRVCGDRHVWLTQGTNPADWMRVFDGGMNKLVMVYGAALPFNLRHAGFLWNAFQKDIQTLIDAARLDGSGFPLSCLTRAPRSCAPPILVSTVLLPQQSAPSRLPALSALQSAIACQLEMIAPDPILVDICSPPPRCVGPGHAGTSSESDGQNGQPPRCVGPAHAGTSCESDGQNDLGRGGIRALCPLEEQLLWYSRVLAEDSANAQSGDLRLLSEGVGRLLAAARSKMAQIDAYRSEMAHGSFMAARFLIPVLAALVHGFLLAPHSLPPPTKTSPQVYAA